MTHHGHERLGDVTLEVRGTVDGHIYDPPSNVPVPGATIRLKSQGLKWFTVYSSASVDGYFTFEGIPEGPFRVSSVVDGRKAENSGEIVEEDEVVTRDLYLQAFATIQGIVLGPKAADGSPGPPMDNVNITVERGSTVVAAGTENPFAFDRMLPGIAVVEATEEGVERSVTDRVRIEEGAEHEVELVMRAMGSATVQVESSTGDPVPYAQIRLTNNFKTDTDAVASTAGGKRRHFDKTADENGRASFEGLLEGGLYATVEDPSTGLRGSAGELLTYEGQEVAIEVALQPSGTIRGTVFLSDGTTPGVGIAVALRLGHAWQLIETDESGFFEFTSVPLLAFDLEAQDPTGPGSFATSNALQSDQEVQDYTIVLDDEDPFVVSMTPESMSRDLPLDTQVVLRFNEPMAACTHCNSWFAFERVQGGNVSFQVIWSEDDSVATLIPNQPLASATTYRVRLRPDAVDRAGRIVDPLFVGGLTTADVVPPRVIDTEPQPDAVQVPVTSGITIQFSEPVDVDSLSGAFQVTDLTTGQPITVTTLVRLDETGVVLTPVSDFELDREIEVRVTGVADPAGNVEAEPFVMTFWTPDVTVPEIQWLRPSIHQTFTSGDVVDFEVRVTDNQGTARVRFEFDEWTSDWLPAEVDPGSPGQPTEEIFTAQLPAPIRHAGGDVVVRTVAEDVWGNVAQSEQTLRLEPLSNQVAPTVGASCPADADFVVPGQPLTTTLAVVDDLGLESAWLEVDGQLVDVVAPVLVADSPVADTTVDLSWTPDVQATAGQVFSLEFFARDFAGNVTSRQLTAQVPGAPVTLAGDPLAGSALYLAAGEHVSAGDLYVDEVVVLDGASWTTEATDFLSATTRVEIQCGGVATLAEVDAPTVRVERGGVLRTPRIEPLRITAELFEVEEDGLVDGAGRGYYGHRELYAPDPQYAPPGVEQAILDGASHGGRGGREGNDSNQPTYGSVYVPALAGAGGYRSNSTHAGRGGNGGGALDVRSDRVILDGRVDVRGHHGGETETEFLHPGSGGAGGSVLLDTAELSGVGWIGAAGGDGAGGSGAGGGRIAIHAEQLNGFDPAQQTNAHGGYRDLLAGRAYAGPGTIFVRTDQSTYGRLWIQNRTEAGEILATGRIDFPELGTGAVAASQVEGANRWIFGSEEFDVAWLGAWMQLEDGAGADLGTYRVLQLDGLRVLLEGGAPASGASTFQGMYLFDELHSTSADLHHSDPLRISGELSLSGEIDVREALDVGSLTVGAEAQITYYAPWNVSGDVLIRSGAVIRPNDRESVEITAGGRLDLEADAWIDVDARGYLSNEAPEGVEPNSSGTGGGSHGGHPWDSTMPDVYDSVYLPNLPGIGGGSDNGYVLLQSEGGGVVVLQADEMTLDGEVTARSRRHVVEGAGGTIRLHSRLLSGSGMLHAGPPEGARHGGGGRIAIWADHLMGFDPVHQSRAWGGGTSTDQNGAAHAAAGTVLVHTAESSHGRLIIDNGVYETGQTRFTPTPTVLPVLGSGPTMAAVAEGLDLRLDLGTPARWRWAGAYVELLDTGGALLGEFRVIEPDGNTILVADAGSLASQVASYRGVYRFDRIDLLRGAQLDWPDATSLDEMVIGSETLISAPIEARSIRLTSDAVLRPSGRHPIELRADESIVIEAGAVIDVSLMGFEGFLQHGTAPVDILAAGVDSAGSHGGRGLGNEPGEVFGSVYYPSQAGGSGTRNAHGGGVIVLDAPSVQLDGTLLAVGSPHNWQGAGGSVRIEAGILSGSGRVDASADHDSYQRAAGGGRVALLVDQLVGFDPETQVEATAALNTDNFLPTGATGTIFVRDASSTNGRLIVDNRPLEERNAVGIDLRKAFQTELPALGEGTPAAAVANGADLLVDLGAAPKLRWHKAWIELLDDSDSSLGVFQVGALEGNSLRVNGAASFAASVARYRGTYRFDRVDVRGGAGLQSFDPTHADLVDLAGDVEFGGPWTAGEYIIRRDAQIWPVDYEPIELRADTSITVEDGAVLSAVGRSLYDGHVGAPSRAPENVAPGSTNYGAHGGFSGDADGELYGSVYFPRYGGGSGSGWSRGGGVIRLVAPTVQIDGLVDASSTISRSAAGTVAIDADHLLGSGQILASGPTNSGGGRVALRATTTLTFDPSTQASAAGGPYNSSVRGGVGTIYVHGPNSVWGDLLLDNEQAGLTHQHNQPYTYLPRVGAGTVGVVEVDADDPSNVWIEPSATGLVFDLGVEGMWLRTAGGDFRILAEDGSRRRILLEDGAGLIQVGDSYSGLYRFDSATVRLGSYLRIDDESEVGVWSVDEHSAVEASSLALDVVVSGAGSATEGVSYSLSATFTDQETGQVHTATADWGDGVVDPLSVVDGDSGSVSGGHIWADDGTYTVVVCVRDDDGREGCDSLDVTVSNAVPVVTVAEAALATDEGLTLVLADSSFTDGAGDVHTASVDWGDSTSDAASVAFDGGVGTVPGVSHVYSDDGNYQIEVCVRDDEGAEGCDTIAVTVGNVAPQVIAAAGTVALDGVSEKELATYADGGTNDTHSATIDWADGTAVTVGTVVVTGPGQGQVLGDHAYATGGVYDVQVCVVDDSSDSSCAITQVSSADSVPPTVSVAGVNSSYSAGETLTATITTTDAVGVERVEVTFDGAITVLTDGGPVFVYQTQVDPTVTTPRDTALEVVAYDYSGNASTTYSQSVLLGVDLPPDLTLTVTPERIDGRYVAGEGLTFVAEATDNVSVSSLTIDVDGQVTAGTSPLTVDWTAPSVSQSTPVVVTATATDNNGNSSTETLNLQVDPSSNGIPPEVAFSCPTDGAMLPSAYDLPLQLTATDDEGVRQVELFFDDDTTPFAVATPSSAGTLSFDVSETATLPTVSGAPQTVRLRAVVTDAAANSTTSEITVEVVEAVDLATDGSNDWAALASAVGVLRSGILEIDQPRTLGGLIVLDGATVTHPPASVGAETALDLSVGGSVYVACGAALDVTAMGYRPNETYPGETTSANGSGGSHLGVGGQFANSPPGSTYGSVYYPTEPGAGGDHAGWGLAGGGVVLVEASEMVIDGAIRANGDSRPTGGYRAGAGGSIWLDVSGDLSGAGSIEANGGEVPGGYGAGGGGTVAVYHGSSESDPVSDLLARGGGAKYAGGAGTVYAHGPGSTYGELTLDVGSVDGITDLPSLGSGTAQTGSSGTRLETDLPSIQPYFVGHWVEIYDASGAWEGTWRVESIDGAAAVLLETGATVDVGDTWQGVYRFDRIEMLGDLELRSDDPIRVSDEHVIHGTVEADLINGHDLVLRSGSTLTHRPTTDSSSVQRLEISLSGRLTIESGAAIDVSAKGYRPNQTYPGETGSANGSGGSHLGLGGQFASSLPGSTYGSVYFPSEPGAGGQNSGVGLAGGGVVLVEAAELVVDGAIRANGDSRPTGGYRGGAGGSVWLDVSGDVSGTGSIEANGGEVPGGYGAGGGGGIAVYHGSSGPSLVSELLARGGAANYAGGVGAVYLHGPSSTYGDLILDAGAVVDGITDLPSLGTGTAQAGSSGTRLETDLSSIQPYFVGHWVEIYNASGALEGTWRVESIDGSAVVLESGATVDAGDGWQGVYRFDDMEVLGDLELRSADPIRVSGEQAIDGTVETDRITGHDLLLRSGSTLTHRATTDSSNAQRLEILLTGRLMIESGAAIDVSGKGYRPNQTHPGETTSANGSGGSHLGRGGQFATSLPGSTYGSVYYPTEPGAGGQNGGVGLAGGGVVLVEAGELVVDGAILANGDSQPTGGYRGGAGGSIWLDVTGQVSGAGSIEANGGEVPGGYGAGGGGAVAVYHGGIDTGLTSRLMTLGGAEKYGAGAGVVYLFGPTSTYGDLIVDSADVVGNWTELPALGAGAAQVGSGADVLVTDLATPVQTYFVGHWVEIYDGATGALEGTYRIAEILPGGLSVRLAANGPDTPAVDPDDLWQGVYLFDDLLLTGDALGFTSDDPVIATGTQTIRGAVTTERIVGGDLTLDTDALLTHPLEDGASRGLDIRLTGDLTLASGAAIDVSGQGYANSSTHGAATLPGAGGGGSHLGLGGHAPGTSYGSVTEPWEHGGGGENSTTYGGFGGGRVRIVATDLTFVDSTSAIRANGLSTVHVNTRGGAGGSIWIDLSGLLTGDGAIEAAGGDAGASGYGSGGGGAVAIYHQGSSGTALSLAAAWGGVTPDIGGAGTLYVHGPTSTEGDLIVRSAGSAGRDTVLPSLGQGSAGVGSSGATLVTGLPGPIPDYFLGHFVEISTAAGTVKGTFPIQSIDGATLTLADDDGVPPSVAETDTWRGVYRFDSVTVDDATLSSSDAIFESGTEIVP
ncbi:MAG: Ig-like domain-containing protein [Thermoanaerobaculia bacterium]|nr:Ig-like domain-containing protein [Thermoanaerobaculia bacterium]